MHPLLSYAVVGLGAAAYSPAKYGILTELLPPQQLVIANGWIEGATVASIILGVLLGGVLITPRVSAALLGFDLPMIDTPIDTPPAGRDRGDHGASTSSPRSSTGTFPTPASIIACRARIRSTWCASSRTAWRCCGATGSGQISLATTTLFWGAGATLQFIVIDWAARALSLNLSQAAMLQGVVAFGIAVGAMLAAQLVTLRGAVRVLPVGAAMGVVVMVMVFVHYIPLAMLLMVAIGACAGFFVVPMNALLQHRGHVLMGAGHSIAVQNFNENIGILVMVGLYAPHGPRRAFGQLGDHPVRPVGDGVDAARHVAPPSQPARVRLDAPDRHRQARARVVSGRRPGSEHDRLVGQLVRGRGRARKMPRKQRGNFADALRGAVGITRFAERRFHSRADRLPFARVDETVDAAIGDDLDVAIGEQHVDQHAGVLLGIPHAQQAEHFERALARRELAQHAQRRQRALDREAHLAAMRALARRDRMLDVARAPPAGTRA